MKWLTPTNQTLQSPFPLLYEIVSYEQPNKMPKVIFVSHDAILAPITHAPQKQKKKEAASNQPHP
jgi:hypothetical protein